MTSRTARNAAGLSIAGLVMVGFQVPASAQQGPPGNPGGQGTESCPATNPEDKPPYPPVRSRDKGVNNNDQQRGQQMNAWSGCSEFAPGQPVRYGVSSPYQEGGTVVASVGGEATVSFAVPANLPNGQHHVVFSGTGLTGAPHEVRIPFVVSGGPTAAAPGTGAGPSQGGTVTVGGVALPFTGSDEVVPMTVLGLGLVVAGAGIVVVARRRRSGMLNPTD